MLLNDFNRNNDNLRSEIKRSEDAFAIRRSSRYFKKGPEQEQRVMGIESKGEKDFQGICHYCKEKGHFARDRPKKNNKNNSRDGSNRPNRFSANCVAGNDVIDQIPQEEALLTSDSDVTFDWIIDSGATQHMTFNWNSLMDYFEFKTPCPVNLGDNRVIFAYGRGTYRITSDLDGNAQRIVLHDVLYLPDLEKNLLSVRSMAEPGAAVNFEGDQCKIIRDEKLLAVGKLVGKLYYLKLVNDDHAKLANEGLSGKELWHNRYGHLCMGNAKKLWKENMVDGMTLINSVKNMKPFVKVASWVNNIEIHCKILYNPSCGSISNNTQ